MQQGEPGKKDRRLLYACLLVAVKYGVVCILSQYVAFNAQVRSNEI